MRIWKPAGLTRRRDGAGGVLWALEWYEFERGPIPPGPEAPSWPWKPPTGFWPTPRFLRASSIGKSPQSILWRSKWIQYCSSWSSDSGDRRRLSPKPRHPPEPGKRRPTFSRSDHVRANPLLQLDEVERGIFAGSRWQRHGQSQYWDFPRYIVQAADHVPLARHCHNRTGPPLPDNPPGQLTPRCDEDRHSVLPRDAENPVQRHLRQAAGDQQQQLALPHLPPAGGG